MGVFVRVQLITCRQIDSRVVVNSITAPKGLCRDYHKKHLTARKAFAGINVGLGLAFVLYWAVALGNFNFTSTVFAFCWTWNVSALYFLVSLGLHCRKDRVNPTMGPKVLGRRDPDAPAPVEPWTLCRGLALVLFQTAFDVAWGGVVAYGVFFFSQAVFLGDALVMATAFLVPPLLLTLDLSMSQLVFVPLHFVFPVAFLVLWVLVLWAYTTITGLLGDCAQHLNATSCWCSRNADNQSDIVQCYNASVGLCKWSEYGRCGWPYNPNPYHRVPETDLKRMFDPPIECAYATLAALEAALAANGTHSQGHCTGDFPGTLYSVTDPWFVLYAAAACAGLVGAHVFGVLITCVREAACPTTIKPVAAAHRIFVLPEPAVDLRFVDETGEVPTE